MDLYTLSLNCGTLVQHCKPTHFKEELVFQTDGLLNSKDELIFKHLLFGHTHIHLFQLRLLPWTMFHSLQCTMVNQFCSGKLSLVHVPWNNGDHLWKGVQDSFQVKWLLKLFSMSVLKNLIFKISWQKIRSVFYHLIKLRFCMGQPKIHSIIFFSLSFKIIASKIDKHVVLVIYCCSTNALN